MYGNCLCPIINKPTRITTESATLLDNIFTNRTDKEILGGLLFCDITDHLPVFAVLKNVSSKKMYTQTQGKWIRCCSSDNIDSFRRALCNQTWNEIYASTNVNEAYDAFLHRYIELYNLNCPKIKISHKKNNEKPWITKGIEKACKKKNALYRQFVKEKSKEAENTYKNYKNKLVNIIRNSKKQYYHKLIEQHKLHMQETWKIINKLTKKNNKKQEYPSYFKKNDIQIRNPMLIANELNEYFANVGNKLAMEIKEPIKKLKELSIQSNKFSMFLSEVSSNEILEIVRTFQNKRSKDWNDIDMSLIKNTIEFIVEPLTHIFNMSFREGIFPNNMKIAKIIPIFKNGDRHIFTNYRPISLLSQFSKILEKPFVKRMNNFIGKFNLLHEDQYGFRARRSTSMAIMHLVDHISSSIEKKKFTVGVFVDLQKAFDTLNHTMLLSRLQKYGFRGIAYSWLESYLINRCQYVYFNNEKSDMCPVTCGVPQGSLLGPILFILYINDLCKVSDLLNCVLYADDTTLYLSGDNLEKLLSDITKELSIIKQWFDSNKLSLNQNKTKYIILGYRKRENIFELKIEDVVLERVNEIKFLGVILNHTLSWKPHITYILSKLSKSLAILHKVKYFLNTVTLYILYCSFMIPYLTYCLEIWGHSYKSNT
uniref:Reverse transcriptase domain-containing protein n=1 Tax=Oryzias latipes TaxID=8090 RepID=A0A3B3H5U1_ORYLA